MPVRTLADLRSNGPNNQPMPQAYSASGNQGQGLQGYDRNQNANIVVVGGDDEPNPQFPSMTKVLARDFNRNTFIFWITIVEILMFIVELIYGAVTPGHEMFDPNNMMAGPGGNTTLDLGGKFTEYIRQGQIYRLVTPIILHGGFLHIFSNLFFQTYLCYTYELRWGTGRTAYFYLLTGIGGSVMSAVASPYSISVGASGALMGMLGCEMAYLIMNWNEGAGYAQMQAEAAQAQGAQGMQGAMAGWTRNQQEMCNLVCIIMINFMFSMGGGSTAEGANIDNAAHGGGLLSGFLLGFAFVSKAEAPPSLCTNVQQTKLIFLALSLAYFGVLLGYLFFSDNLPG